MDRTASLHALWGAGLATLSQAKGAQVPTVESVTGAFKVMHTEYGPDFHCVACTLPAAA
jgi:hypothetical protein